MFTFKHLFYFLQIIIIYSKFFPSQVYILQGDVQFFFFILHFCKRVIHFWGLKEIPNIAT